MIIDRPLTESERSLIEVYERHSSVHKAGRELGVCGQTVLDRLRKLDYDISVPPEFSVEQIKVISDYYANTPDSLFDLYELSNIIGKSRPNITRFARRRGWTNHRRENSIASKEKMKAARQGQWSRNPHPRGMLGKNHSDATKEKLRNRVMSESAREKISNSSMKRWLSMSREQKIAFSGRQKASWKCGWREVGGQRIFARSRWEANYARYLQWLVGLGEIKKWEHEPETFWFMEIKRGTRTYLPDFRVTENNGSIAYHEVKGWMDPQSITKIKRMAKYYPDVKLIVVDSKSYKALEKTVFRMVTGWETNTTPHSNLAS